MKFGPRDYVSISVHAIERMRSYCDRTKGLSGMQVRDLIAAAVDNSVAVGAQVGDCVLLESLDNGMEGIVFAILDPKHRSHKGGKLWVVKTVLRKEDAIANVQSMLPVLRDMP